MTSEVKGKKIRARYGLTRLPDGDVGPLLVCSLNGLTNNATIYSKPPIDPAVYDAGITAYLAAVPVALDGSRTAIAHKNKLRAAATRMYVELAHYVEANCQDDMPTFLLSGFQPVATTKAPPQPLDQPSILSLVHGPVTGQMKIRISPVPKALSYDVRYGAVPSGGGTPATWTEETTTKTKSVISNLTPGTMYTFQVRALGRLGKTNWSDAVNRMAI